MRSSGVFPVSEQYPSRPTPLVWQVGALCRAVADALQARFNPVSVRGELSGFSRAVSGHCYFSLKDESGQLRCAMFKRSAGSLDFLPHDGELVQVQGRLSVYEPRGDLQLVVEQMSRAGQGNLFEQFLQLKAKLESQGLFDAGRKRPLPVMPRAIGLVTSLGAAALHDVLSTLARRVPHIPVILAPASVQGAQAPKELVEALSKLYQLAQPQSEPGHSPKNQHRSKPIVDVILLVRGGGALEDLWAFNDEALAHAICRSPVPLVSGVGHETDFSIADFCADLRAPTPTAAAELVAPPRDVCLNVLAQFARRLQDGLQRQLDRQHQRLDGVSSRLGRPSSRLAAQHLKMTALAHGLQSGVRAATVRRQQHLQYLADRLPQALLRGLQSQRQRLDNAARQLDLLDPHLVLQRGYAWLSTTEGQPISSCQQVQPEQSLRATLVDGTVDLKVLSSNS